MREKVFHLVVCLCLAIAASGLPSRAEIPSNPDLLPGNWPSLIRKALPPTGRSLVPGGGRFLGSQQWLKKPKGVQEGDWVIGLSDPNEVVTVTTETTLHGNITLLNQATLLIQNTTFRLSGNLFLSGTSLLQVQDSSFFIEQDFAYQYGLQASDQGAVHFERVHFESQGSWSAALLNSTSVEFDTVSVDNGFITWGFFNDSTAMIRNCHTAGEFLPLGENHLEFDDTNFLLLWVTLPGGSQIDVAFPQGDFVPAWEIQPSSPFATGIPYSVQIRDCTDVQWAITARSGSQATIRDSHLRVAGPLFSSTGTVSISGVSNKAHLSDTVYTWSDVSLHFINTTVDTWNYYVYGRTYLTLDHCLFGEVLVDETGRADIIASLCDGSGGYVGAVGGGAVFLILSANLSQTTSKGNGLLYAANSALLSPLVDADGASLMILANSLYTGNPAAHQSAAVVDGKIEPLEGETDSVLSIRGSARVIPGSLSAIQFTGYTVEYGMGEEPLQWFPTDGMHTHMVRDGTLASWNTSGLVPGSYKLRLTLTTNLTSAVQPTTAAQILPSPGPTMDSQWRFR
jgi:hypothetical protein